MPIRARVPDLEAWKAQVKCQMGCPVATDAGRYVQLVAAGRYEEGYLVARSPNPFASVCGRVCAAPCEDACRRGSIDAPITIRALKRTLTERYGVESFHPDTQDRLRDTLVPEGNRYAGHLPVTPGQSPRDGRRKVAVVGSGPAGVSAAHDLALLGYSVTIFESAEEPGGMMRFGIPEYRLPRSVVQGEIDKVVSLGVTLKTRTGLSPSYGLAALRAEGFEAVFLAVGVQKGRDLQLPGSELDGVVKAVDYLLNANRGYRMDLGRRVVVIGGGFVAFDAARMALRTAVADDEVGIVRARLEGEGDSRLMEALDSARAAVRGGATEVTIVSLESFEEMPVLRTAQGHEEFEEAKKEGIAFHPRRGPKRFLGNGKLSAVELRRVRSVFDPSGRFAPEYDDGDVVTLPADGCVLAIGQRADLSFLRPEDGVALTPGGIIQVDRATLATTAPGVYAGGDVAFGPRNLIEAVANGKRAARSIHEYLSRGAARAETVIDVEKIPTRDYRMIAGFEVLDRRAPPTIELGRRSGIAEVEAPFPDDEAARQGARCLVCHVQTIYDPEKCVLCGRCVDVCPEYCLSLVPLDEVELPEEEKRAIVAAAEAGGLPLSVMLKDDVPCIRCGLCAIRCPTDAMTMERFQITERYAAPAAPGPQREART